MIASSTILVDRHKIHINENYFFQYVIYSSILGPSLFPVNLSAIMETQKNRTYFEMESIELKNFK